MTCACAERTSYQPALRDSDFSPTNMKLCVQYILLGTLIVIIWALLSLPIIFYHLPLHLLNVGSSTTNTVTGSPLNSSNTSNHTSPAVAPLLGCPTPVPYTGSVCSDVLQQYSDCLPGNTPNSTILLTEDRTGLQDMVNSRLELLELFAYSKECIKLARPLMCAFYFSAMCDSNGQSHKLSRQQCMEASRGVCKREWTLASGYVPDCNSNLFTVDTQLSTTCTTRRIVSEKEKKVESVIGNCSLNCSVNFHCLPDSSSCTPTCDWIEYEEPANTIINVSVIVISSMGLFFSILTLIMAAIRRSKLCSFPSVIILYQTGAALIIALFVAIGFINQKALYCWPDNDLTTSMKHTTPFCIVSGMVTHYFFLFLSLWWLCHIAVIYWKLQFPFHARSWELDDKMKYVHLVSAVVVSLLSFIPLIVIIIVDWQQRAAGANVMGTLGFGKTRFHPLVCTAIHRKSVYYSLVLPINLLVPVGVTLLILSIWLIHKNYQRSKETEEKQKFKLSTAECKILFIVCYYVVITVVAMSGLTFVSWTGNAFVKALFSYFLCQRGGYNPDKPCTRDRINELHQAGLVAISFIFVGLLPLVNCIFTTNFREMAATLRKCCCQHRDQPNKREEAELLITKHSSKSLNDTESEHEN